MFVNKVDPNKGALEIVYDIQWKTPGNDDDKAKIIGIVDTPDTNLDWNTFKSYLIQNSGNMNFTTDDIRISYLDSDDDLIRVDSEIEFRECLKFSRTRARRGRKVTMKVNMVSNTGTKPKESSKYSEDCGAKVAKPKIFCLKNKDMQTKTPKKPVSWFDKCSPADSTDQECVPKWFEKYMAKFKAELVDEITASVVANLEPAVDAPNGRPRQAEASAAPPNHFRGQLHHHHLHHMLEKRKRKKKVPEEDSSDCTENFQLHLEQRLRHLQKMNKRERKFEKKLDAKLEKLQHKTKQIIEKKHYLAGASRAAAAASCGSTVPCSVLPQAPSAPACDLVMDAMPIDEYNFVPHVLKGETFEQIWKVMNNGQLSWTNETELRFAWGSQSLIPLTPVVKCPPLKPGETGRIKVTLQAPMTPGNYESYWHFHHQCRRFGHWLGCGVIVDQDPPSDSPVAQPRNQTAQCALPVDLTMKCHKYASYNKISTTDDMKLFNCEMDQENEEPNQSADPVAEPNISEQANQELKKSQTDVSLEDYPRLESYVDLFKVEGNESLEKDNIPDLVQAGPCRATSSKTNSAKDFEPPKFLNLSKDCPPVDKLNSYLNLIDDDYESELSVNGASAPEVRDPEKKIENVTAGVANLKINDDRLKKIEMVKKCISEPYDYASGSDSDNISVISGTVSIDTDDSEPSDEFIVVQMPQCVNCDQNLEPSVAESLPVTQPISVEIPKTPSSSDISAHAVQASDNNNNMEMNAYPPAKPVFPPVLVTSETNSEAPQEAAAEEATEKPETQNGNTPEIHSEDENTVYVRDINGRSVPVAKVVTGKVKGSPGPRMEYGFGAGVSHSTFGDPNFGHGPNGPRFPFVHEPSTSPPHCHNPGGPCNFRPQHESPPCVAFSARIHNGRRYCNKENFYTSTSADFGPKPGCHPMGHPIPMDMRQHFMHHQAPQSSAQSTPTPPPRSSSQATPPPTKQPQQTQPRVPKQPSPPKQSSPPGHIHEDIHVEQPRASHRTYPHMSSRESMSGQSSNASNSGSRRSTASSGDSSPVAAAVHILPETLVTGAVNVASSAINTARSVIDMLRPRQEETPAQMDHALRTLSEMGFTNRTLNIILLRRFNNDVSRVISELVQ